MTTLLFYLQLGLPTWDDEIKVINLPPGDEATFHCSASGIPTPEISWTRNGDLIADVTGNTVSI